MTAAVEAQGLTKSFGPITAVDNVDLEIREGELYALLGPNGAGKTTTIKILATLLKPDKGEAWVGGYNVAREPGRVRRTIGLVPQDMTADDEMTGWENVYIQTRLYGLSPEDARHRTRELLETMGLWEARNRKVRGYSGGMRRRLEVAMSLVHRPSILFLDEPTLGLDVQSRRALWSLIQRLRREENVTILLTTHYMEEAEALSDRVAIMHRGRILVTGSPDELKARVRGDTIYLHPASHHGLEPLLRQLRRAGLDARIVKGAIAVKVENAETALPGVLDHLQGTRLAKISIAKPSLEEVFVELTGETLETDAPPLDSFKMRRLIRGLRR